MSHYVRISTNFFTHRKTIRLRSKLGNDAYWIMPRLWAYAAEHQPDGIFEDYSATEIALLVGYDGDAQAMLQAMLQASFLDSDPLRIHAWSEHNAYHLNFSERARKAAAARWASPPSQPSQNPPPLCTPPPKRKERKGKEASIATSIAQAFTDKKPNKEAPSARFISPSEGEMEFYADKIGLPISEVKKFAFHYESNGWKVGKNPMKNWRAAMSGWKTRYSESREKSATNKMPIVPDDPAYDAYMKGMIRKLSET